MKYKNKLYLSIIITSIIAICFISLMVNMISKNGECIDNPFKYSAIRLNESGGNYLCSCRSLDPGLFDFSFNETGITIIIPEKYNTINISNLTFLNN